MEQAVVMKTMMLKIMLSGFLIFITLKTGHAAFARTYFLFCLKYNSINRIFRKTARITGTVISHRFLNMSMLK